MKKLVALYNLICAIIFMVLTFIFLKYVSNSLNYIVSITTMYVLWGIFQFALLENLQEPNKVKTSYYVGILYFNVLSIIFLVYSFMYVETRIMNILLILYIIIQNVVMYLLYRKETNNYKQV